MSHKIFISYKYRDTNVKYMNGRFRTSVRDYVDALQNKLDRNDEINKGESDGEDLSKLSEDAIWERLKDRIYDSTCTILLISKGMKEKKPDVDQWIPWEISYSLKEVNRKTRAGAMKKSAPNAIIAVVIPDENGNYDYCIVSRNCCKTKCRTINAEMMFDIVANNMFNKKKKSVKICNTVGNVYFDNPSYITMVKWDDFINDIEYYLDEAYKIQQSIEQYDIQVEI